MHRHADARFCNLNSNLACMCLAMAGNHLQKGFIIIIFLGCMSILIRWLQQCIQLFCIDIRYRSDHIKTWRGQVVGMRGVVLLLVLMEPVNDILGCRRCHSCIFIIDGALQVAKSSLRGTMALPAVILLLLQRAGRSLARPRWSL